MKAAPSSVLRRRPLPLACRFRFADDRLMLPLDPIETDADLRATENWLERANFRLMLATQEACRTGDPSIILPHVQSLTEVLTGPLANVSGAARDFAGAKSLFLVMASCDLAGAKPASVMPSLVTDFTQVAEDTGDPLRLSARNNHMLMKALAAGLYGAMTGQEVEWQRALGIYRRYITAIPDDGIPRAEAVRGASAAWYLNLAVMLMTRFQAMVRHIDGYVPQEEADTLLAGVQALVRVIDDPSILHRWSRRNMYPHPKHVNDPFQIDLGFLHGYHRSRHYLAWVPLLEDLYGPDAVPAQLRRVIGEAGDNFPKCNEFVGGFVDLMT